MSAREYQHVFKRSQRSSDSYLTVLARNNSSGCSRLGLAITKKRIKTAVQRNRLKRLARESFRQHQEVLKDIDVIVLAKRDTSAVANQVLFNSLKNHWQRLSRLCKKS